MTDFQRAMIKYVRKNYPWYAAESEYLDGFGEDYVDDDEEYSDGDDEDETENKPEDE